MAVQAGRPESAAANRAEAVRIAVMSSAGSAGFPVDNLELLRIGNNFIFVDRRHRRIYRVPVFQRDASALIEENQRITELALAGGPLLAPSQVEPLSLPKGDLATVWPLGDDPVRDPKVSIAPILADLHGTRPVDGLEVWSGFERAERRIGLAEDLDVPKALVTAVQDRLQKVKDRFPHWSTETVVHGDPHTGNVVLVGDDHRLIDLDDLALGCPEIDLATICTAYRRFNRMEGSWDDFTDSYGLPFDDKLLEAFVELRQLTMTAWLLTLWQMRKESHDEAKHRIATLDTDDLWNPL